MSPRRTPMSVETARRLAVDGDNDAELTLELVTRLAEALGVDLGPGPTEPPPPGE